jgi:hypothetical protein
LEHPGDWPKEREARGDPLEIAMCDLKGEGDVDARKEADENLRSRFVILKRAREVTAPYEMACGKAGQSEEVRT